MIVKNEEAVLARCLNSITGLWDELIIVDTGSTDRTVEIANEFGAKVIHYDWIAPGHKGDARNFGIVQAVSQWIVVIDADEVLPDPAATRAAILAAREADALYVRFDNYVDGQVNLSWRQIRVFRHERYVYKYREHEVPVALVDSPSVIDADIVFQHRAPDGRATGKKEPMLARLTFDARENPTDPHPLYFLHRECLNQGQYERAIELGQRYLGLTSAGGYVQADVHGNIAMAYQNLGNHAEATKQMHLAAACEPNKREWLYKLAVLYSRQSLWTVALAMLRAAAELTPSADRQWEPQTTARIYDLMNICQQNIAHALAHSHTH